MKSFSCSNELAENYKILIPSITVSIKEYYENNLVPNVDLIEPFTKSIEEFSSSETAAIDIPEFFNVIRSGSFHLFKNYVHSPRKNNEDLLKNNEINRSLKAIEVIYAIMEWKRNNCTGKPNNQINYIHHKTITLDATKQSIVELFPLQTGLKSFLIRPIDAS